MFIALVKEFLLGTTVNSSKQAVDGLVDSLVNSDAFTERLEEKLASLITSQNEKFREASERIEALEKLEA